MTTSKTPQARFRVAHLNPHQPTAFSLAPDAAARQALADELGLSALPRLRFSGRIRAVASDAWEVTGQLDAKVVQPCVVTLAPVATTLQEEVQRVFSPHVATPEGDEAEMPDDETEPLGQFIDAEAIMVEELSLALPLYPRAEGAALDAAEPEEAEQVRKPFAGLADLLKDSRKPD
ncbi:Uncharacterized metal-binding protein YceD, DUF177 family [Paracoccus aminovorans]|uniref:Uncharacterized metal-binding protein YceD, DUF177 family n=1 Tax=Paracoccus aminovorans TaxID=34004 RepID=A0A1I2YWF9_9RHOB|nr:DUF177 domain-containing protein [Paracoccus aminovorans]CQR85816.1 hypothetical protein JCM7685_1242 [Paracoccus aminovorans]SFH29987.1 Uncharacterized metal-binding protein YceD, DUF177 family [Paracoccus aminovorans]